MRYLSKSGFSLTILFLYYSTDSRLVKCYILLLEGYLPCFETYF